MPRQYTRIPPAERFWKYVDKTATCWLWTASVYPAGYGSFSHAPGKHMGAHRYSWELHFGPIPDGLFVCHTCDVKTCVRPDHLWLGTSAENTADKVAKGRQARGDASGARLHIDRMPRGEQHGSHTHPERIARGERNGQHTHPEMRLYGDKNHQSKLTWGIVREIRARYVRGDIPMRELAVEYGVSLSNIEKVVYEVTWKEPR